MIKRIIFSVFYIFLAIPSAFAEQLEESFSLEEFASQMYSAWRAHRALPHISKQINDITHAQATEAQYLFVQNYLDPCNGGKISGYKAGLTSKAGQKKFNVKSAISGVMFARHDVKKDEILKLSDYRKLMLETEIGFILAEKIIEPVDNITQLKNKISAVMPVIEMPNLAFKDLKNITGQDIIAANAISNRYLLGKQQKMPLAFSVNEIKIKLDHIVAGKKRLINQGFGRDALGDQWKALLWLVNERLAAGYRLKKGQFLITGALGNMIPAKVGRYQADFGQLGLIDFDVVK